MIIAESIFSRIGNLRKVMSDPQIACLLSGTKGVESEHYKDLIIKVDDIVAKCPVTAGQMLQMFPLLKIATKEGNKLIPNEQSLILAKMKADLFPSEK